MKKSNKIIVCLSPNESERSTMIAKLLVRLGFARTAGDAKKIIAFSAFDVDLPAAYFVAAQSFNFRSSAHITQRLYEMAVRGNLVIVGVKKMPPEMEFMCEIFTVTDII
ncbi:MAG: hypothetical protein FWC39_07400 [Bacteroidetes bacterium]|nr:hypothetical protein [Bacteroidota bacterium]